MKLKGIRISTKLLLSFGLIFISILLLSLLYMNQIQKSWERTNEIYQHPLAVSNAARDIQANTILIQNQLQNLIFIKDESIREEILSNIESLEIVISSKLGIVQSRYLGNAETIENARRAFDNLKINYDRAISRIRQQKTDEALFILNTESKEKIATLLKSTQVIIDFAENKANQYYDETQHSRELILSSFRYFALYMVIAIFIVSLYLYRSILVPVRRLTSVTRQIQGGNLSARAEILNHDELGFLTNSINRLAKSIQNQLQLREKTGQLSSQMITSQDLNEYAEQMVHTLKELTRSSFAAFYLLNKKNQKFELFASLSLNADSAPSFDLLMKEGEAGNLISKDAIVHHQKLPGESAYYFKTVAGNILPKEIISVPLLNGNHIEAFITLGNIKAYKKYDLNFLEQSRDMLNTSFVKILSRRQINLLVEELHKKNLNLQNQSEQLQQQAEELEATSSELQQQAHELEEQNIILNSQRKDLEQANRLKTEFLSNMSHELRTPLNSILALSKVLSMQSEDKLNEEELNYLNIIRRNGQNLLMLINDILDLSKIEAGKLSFIISEFHLSDMFEIIHENFDVIAKSKGIKLIVNPPDQDRILTSDEGKFLQILQNVVGNAVKFTDEGFVQIDCKNVDNSIQIVVKDSGIGIPEEFLQTVFDEFRQADGSVSKKYEGTGLGLSIAKRLTEKMGGTIKVSSQLNQGSTFTLQFPLEFKGDDSINYEVLNQGQIAGIANSRSKQFNSKPHILIIEDNAETILQVKYILEKEGYKISSSKSGEDALQFIEHTIPDALILDLNMPGMDGFEVLEKVRGTEKTRNIPVLIMTAKDITNEELGRLSANNIQQLVKKGMIDKKSLLSKIKHLFDSYLSDKFPQKSGVKNERKTILIIEDNPDNLTTLKAIIPDEYQVLEANNGEDGFKLISKRRPDCIFLDINLPRLDGLSITKIIKDDEKLKHIPLIAVTALAMPHDQENLLAAGFDEYISKPIDPEKVLTILQKWV